MVALFAVAVAVSAWLPWLSTGIGSDGWGAAIGGQHVQHRFGTAQLIVVLSSALLVAGAVVGRGLSTKGASVAALLISLAEVALLARYYSVNVKPTVPAAYGLYVGTVSAVAALVCAMWALAISLRR